MKKLAPTTVIFDLGSTLIEYEPIPWEERVVECAESSRRFLVSQGLNPPGQKEYFDVFESVWLQFRNKSRASLDEYQLPEALKVVIERLGEKADDILVSRMFDAYYEPIGADLYIYEDTRETLQWLRNSRKTIGLISNTIFPEFRHQAELRRFDIHEFFDFTIFSSTFGKRKPHADIFREALGQCGCEPQEAVYVGDRYLEDIFGPRQIGMPAILKIKPDREYPDQMPLAERRVATLAELVDHIDLG